MNNPNAEQFTFGISPSRTEQTTLSPGQKRRRRAFKQAKAQTPPEVWEQMSTIERHRVAGKIYNSYFGE